MQHEYLFVQDRSATHRSAGGRADLRPFALAARVGIRLPQVQVVTARAPAKINLELRVGGLKPDGFHTLATVFQAVDLADEVTATVADDGAARTTPDQLLITGPYSQGVPPGGENLALRALRFVADAAGTATELVHRTTIRLVKNIPVAAGLAGGSADAAAALLAANALWDARLSRTQLHDIAVQLGSDVPFALAGGTALGLGRGTQLTPVLARCPLTWVLAISRHQLSTPQVFAELDRLRQGQGLPVPQVAPKLLQALRSGDPQTVANYLANDMQCAAVNLLPQLDAVMQRGLAAGALAAQVSGSGPTVMFLTADRTCAAAVAAAVTSSPDVVAAPVVHGPVSGAHMYERTDEFAPTNRH